MVSSIKPLTTHASDGHFSEDSPINHFMYHSNGDLNGVLNGRHYVTGTSASKTNTPMSSLATSNASRVTVPIDGEDLSFSAILLRDLCECSACVHESTRQRQYSVADIPPEIRACTVDTTQSDPVSVKLTWESDAPGFDEKHETVLAVETLRALKDLGATPGPFQWRLDPHVLWEGYKGNAPDFTFHAHMQDDQILFQVMKQLRTHGLVFITEIPHGMEDAIVKIATRMGPMKDTFYGFTWDVRTVPAAINAAYTSSNLGFHTDLLYFQNPAHIQLLHCLQSSSSGGASLFVDAFKAAEDLFNEDEDAFNALATIPVNYQYKHPASNLYHTTKVVIEMQPLSIGDVTYYTVREYLDAWKQQQSERSSLPDISLADCLEQINWGPPFLAPFSLQDQCAQVPYAYRQARETLNQKVDRWHAAARKFSALLHRPQFLHERLMKPGECAVFANTRVLHARRQFDSGDVGKARWLKGGYVDKDPYLSKLLVLGEKYGSSHQQAGPEPSC